MKTLLLILASLPAFAATITVVAEPSITSVILRFSSANSPCLLEVSTSPTYLPVVNDVDSSLFTGANSDAANTSVVTTGNQRAWQVGKKGAYGGVALALDGSNYSRALQAATKHYYRVTCGADSGTGDFTTKNVPLGNTYVPNQPVDGSTGAWLQPTLSYTDRSQVVIDPITGVALRRTMMGGDAVLDPGTYHAVTAGTGATWTTPNNIAAPDTVYASYSGTAQAKLAATMYTGVDSRYTLDFVTIKITGYGNGATTAVRTVQICLSVDGSTCVSSTTDLILPTSVGDVYYNQSLAIGDFMGWTAQLNTTVIAGMKLLVWKKATSGSDTVFLDNAQVGWGQSVSADPTSGGFDDISSRPDASGWINHIISNALYFHNTITGEVRFGGKFALQNSTLALTVPDWRDVSVTSCQTSGDSSRAWDQTTSNLYYCGGLLNNYTPGILRFNTDATHAAVTQNTLFAYSNPVVLTPIGSDLNTLIAAYAPTVLPYFHCLVEGRQGNNLLIGCWANNQNSWCFLAVFSLGNGTAMDDASCGTITAGRCSNSGVGIIGVNQLENLNIARGCTCHTIRTNGDTVNYGWEIGGFSKDQDYGNYPTASALTADMDSTQTSVHVTSTWQSGAVSKTGTISSATGDYHGYHAPVSGSGGISFKTQTTVGDQICAAGQCRTVVYIESSSDYLEVDTAFSPNLVNETWTSAWPAQPSGYAIGEPVAPRFPRWVFGARVNDFFLIGSETVRIMAKPSSTVWTVQRGCSRDISLPYIPCTGMGSAHTSGDAVTLTPNSPQDVLNASSPATYWNFLLDPTGSDTNYADWSNGNHGTILSAYPYGFGGNHNTARGNANATMISMADYVSMASSASGGLANMPLLTLPPNYNFQEHQASFGGKYPSGAFGLGHQRHPSNQHYNWGAPSYFLNFFTDAPAFANGGPVASSTVVEGNLRTVVMYDDPAGPHSLDRKYLPTFVLSGKTPFQDISGPSSHIVDSATAYTYCYAEAPGDCRTAMDVGGASVAGQLYMNGPGVTSSTCTGSETWDGHTNDVCVGNQLAFGSASVQYGVQVGNPTTIVSSQNHTRSRTLVKFGAGMRSLANYSNAKTIEGGLWMFSPAASNAYNQYLLVQAPPMANLDSIDRSNFGLVHLTINPPQGQSITNVIVKFGYDSTLQCTSRAESCVAAASNAPYFFASETYSGVSCSTSCSLDVPFFPANVGWYQIVYRNSGNAVVSSGPVSLVVVP